MCKLESEAVISMCTLVVVRGVSYKQLANVYYSRFQPLFLLALIVLLCETKC